MDGERQMVGLKTAGQTELVKYSVCVCVCVCQASCLAMRQGQMLFGDILS